MISTMISKMIKFEPIEWIFQGYGQSAIKSVEQIFKKHIPQDITFHPNLSVICIDLDFRWINYIIDDLLYQADEASFIFEITGRLYLLKHRIIEILTIWFNLNWQLYLHPNGLITPQLFDELNLEIVRYDDFQRSTKQPTLNDIILHYVGIKSCNK